MSRALEPPRDPRSSQKPLIENPTLDQTSLGEPRCVILNQALRYIRAFKGPKWTIKNGTASLFRPQALLWALRPTFLSKNLLTHTQTQNRRMTFCLHSLGVIREKGHRDKIQVGGTTWIRIIKHMSMKAEEMRLTLHQTCSFTKMQWLRQLTLKQLRMRGLGNLGTLRSLSCPVTSVDLLLNSQMWCLSRELEWKTEWK